MRATLAIVISCLWLHSGHSENWLFVDGKRVRLIFDTGSSDFCFFPNAVKRLGLKTSFPSPDVQLAPGEVATKTTQECSLTIWRKTIKTQFCAIDLPRSLSETADGLIGWWPVRKNIFSID